MSSWTQGVELVLNICLWFSACVGLFKWPFCQEVETISKIWRLIGVVWKLFLKCSETISKR